MILVLSGEGPTDLGQCNNAQGLCSDPYFQPGPMAVLVDNIVAKKLKYSMLAVTPAAVRYVGEQFLANLAKARKGNRVSLVGKKQGQETAYFYINAWMLGEFAQKLKEDEEDEAVAVSFRDCDGTRAAASTLWNGKYESIVDGFRRSGFQRGGPICRSQNRGGSCAQHNSRPTTFAFALRICPAMTYRQIRRRCSSN